MRDITLRETRVERKIQEEGRAVLNITYINYILGYAGF